MIDYEAAKREMPGLKSKLTRAKKSKDPDKVFARSWQCGDRSRICGKEISS